MKVAKSTTAAVTNGTSWSGVAGASGTGRPSVAISAAAKSPWSNAKPLTMTTAPSANMRNIIGTRVRS